MPETNNAPQALFKLPPDLYSRNKTITFLLSTFGLDKAAQVLDIDGEKANLKGFFAADQNLAGQTVTAYVLGGDFKQTGNPKLPFADNHFDVVIAAEILESTPSQAHPQILEELCRVSKNYVILSAPFRREFVENVENMVAQQYMENTSTRHPLVEQHLKNGMPEQTEVEGFLKEKGFAYMTIGEGNLANWALQQFVNGAKQGEKGAAERFTGFNEFINKNFHEMGNFQEPTYRTIFCISKEKTLKSNTITEGIAAMNKFMVKTFCYALKIAFTEDRKMLNYRKKQLNSLADTMLAARAKMTELKTQNIEVFSLMQERQQAFNLLQAENNGKGLRVTTLEEQQAVLATEINNAKTLIQKQDEQLKNTYLEVKNLAQHVHSKEALLKQKTQQLEEKEDTLSKTTQVFLTTKTALAAIENSPGWKTVLFFRKLKNNIFTRPLAFIKSGTNQNHSQQATTIPQQYQLHIAKNKLTNKELTRITTEQQKFEYQPVISILMPVYNVTEHYLVKAIASVKQQTYSRWELCICDDASTLPYIKPLLERYAQEDSRIHVVFRPKNGGIVKASNDALKMAQGAYVALLDNDDELAPDALYEVAKNLQEQKYDLLYSDEDKLDANGERSEPFFKPDWSPDLLFSINYIGHFSLYRRKLLTEIGGFRDGTDGSRDYDLALRASEKTSSIEHIPKILYHWRRHEQSEMPLQTNASAASTISHATIDTAKKALSDALRRRNIEGEICDGLWAGSYRLKRAIKSQPLVSIIIAFKDKKELLENCLNSIFTKSTYKNFEIILVNNNSELFETQEYLKQISQNSHVTILYRENSENNHAALNNFAAKKAQGEILILLNSTSEIITPDWIEAMLEHADRVEVGAVGAKLLYPNNTLHHAGIILSEGGVARHAFNRHTSNDHGYFGQVDVIKNYSAVSAACIMVRKSVYEDIGGLEDNDVDFCLRLRQKGYLIVYTPYANLYYHGTAEQHQKKTTAIASDPYYNPNLTLERTDFSLRTGDVGETERRK